MKMRKIVAALMAVLLLCCIVPFAAMADGTAATINFGDKANRVSYSTEQQVWAQNGITVTNDKAASTSNVGDYGGDGYPVRFYKGSSVTVECTGMTKIEFYCDDYKTSYANDLQSSISDGSVSLNGTVVTVTFAAPVNSLVIAELVAQVRVDSITVYTGEGGDAPVIPDEPEIPSGDPEADTELSIADAIALALSKEHNVYTEGKYFVTGVITEVYNTMYGNMRLTDDAGNILTIYGTYSADGSDRYDAMDVQPVAGDTVTIYGIVGQYNGSAQIKNGWITEHIAGETPDEPEAPAATVVTNPVAGVAYKFALDQTQKGALYYFTGVMSGFYGATDTSIDNAVDMYVEIVDGGYKLYFNDANGTKQYIKLEQSGTHYNFTFGAEGSVFTLNAEKNAFCAPCGDQICYMGTYGSYVTVGCLTSEKLSDSDYIARLYAVGGETPDEPVIPDEPEVPTEDTLTIAEAIAMGLAQEHNVFTEQKYYVTGVITEVYNEMYGNMRLTDEAGNILTIYGTWSADGATRYDALEVKPVAGDTITVYGIVGQYNGTPQVKNGWIVEHTAAGGEIPDEPVTPDEPETPDEPATPAVSVVTNPVAGVAYKFALEQTQKGELYYFTGAMSGFYGATDTSLDNAVNMYVEIVDGGYKLYFNDAEGTKQYIKLEQSGTHYNFTFGAEGSVFTLDAEKNAFCAPCGDQICYMGTYGSYVTVGCLTSEKLSDSDYIARLYAVNVDEPTTPDEPGTDAPTTGDNSTVYVVLASVLMVLAAATLVVTKKRA